MGFDVAAAQVDQAYRLLEQGKALEALALTTPMATTPRPGHPAIAVHSTVLKALGRREEALTFDVRGTELYATSGVAWHNLAATLQDLERNAESRKAAERAFATGLDAPETWVVLAHALAGLQDMAGAERAFRQAIRRRPADAGASQSLAKVIWMTTGDWEKAVAPLRAARDAGGAALPLVQLEARILESAGRRDELRALFEQALARHPGDAGLLGAAAHVWMEEGDLDRASALIEQAVVAGPSDVTNLIQFAAVRMAQGRPNDAFQAAARAAQINPLDQSTWGWIATASRAMGTESYGKLYDYSRFVRAYRIEAPEGWASLDAFLADLSAVLRRLHVLKVQPAEQSLRLGTQTTQDLSRSSDPVLMAFFAALDKPIRAYLTELGRAPDPVRSRNTGAYAFQSAWSVLLKPNGFHVNHFHPLGWISSAFYVEVPKAAVDGDRREGWIQFGEPPFRSYPPLPPEHYEKPEPGKLVLFPSYMWHGTVPFSTQESRMTIAFDLLPA